MEKKKYMQPQMEVIEMDEVAKLLAGSAETIMDIDMPARGPALAPFFDGIEIE